MNMLDTIKQGIEEHIQARREEQTKRTRAAMPFALSDDDLETEHSLEEDLIFAIKEFERVIDRINKWSSCVSISKSEWEGFLHDSVPSQRYWLEQIQKGRENRYEP